MRKIAIICVGLLLGLLPSMAQTSFLNLPTDAVSAAMGGADMAYRVDGFSVLDNMASTATSEGMFQIGLSGGKYQPQYLNSTIGGLSAFFKATSKLSVGVSYDMEVLPSQDVTSSQGSVIGSFSPMGHSVGLGVAYNVWDNLSIGVGAEYVFAKIYTLSQNCMAANFSLNYKLKEGAVALSVNNIAFAQTNMELLSTVDVAFSYKLLNTENHLLAAAVNLGGVVAPSDASSLYGGVGVEYGLMGHYFVRGGYSYADPNRYMNDYASVGCGLNFFDIGLDFAYLIGTKNSSPINNSWVVSATYKF